MASPCCALAPGAPSAGPEPGPEHFSDDDAGNVVHMLFNTHLNFCLRSNKQKLMRAYSQEQWRAADFPKNKEKLHTWSESSRRAFTLGALFWLSLRGGRIDEVDFQLKSFERKLRIFGQKDLTLRSIRNNFASQLMRLAWNIRVSFVAHLAENSWVWSKRGFPRSPETNPNQP